MALGSVMRGILLLRSSLAPAAIGKVLTRSLSSAMDRPEIRNIAVIAHVDHGKTTLMDRLLQFCGATAGGTDRVMDSNQFERERGITISSKYTSFTYAPTKGPSVGKKTLFNLVDTPGHADFGGEVERVLGLVDGAVLVIDALEGPLSQTKFVLGKALARGLRPVVLINKVDREGATQEQCGIVESAVFDTFVALDANDEQLDFPTLYASAREGWVSEMLPTGDAAKAAAPAAGMAPLLDLLHGHVPPPTADPSAPFAMLVSMTHRDAFLGRIATGRIAAGSLSPGDRVKVITHADGGHAPPTKVTKLFKRVGTETVEIDAAWAGDIVSLAGAGGASVADTVAAPEVTEGLTPGTVDPPTLSMVFGPNTSPLSGREGTQLTGSKIGERLAAEAEVNVSMRVAQVEGSGGESFEVQARGELQLGLLIENMRREGFELSISPPKVLLRTGEQGERLEPLEELVCEVEESHSGDVIEALTVRKGTLLEMGPAAGSGEGVQRLVFEAPARGLIGFRSLFASLTRGSGVLHRAFARWGEYLGPMDRVRKGALVATGQGKATLHALGTLEARGALFVGPGEACYEGMVVGESSRSGDLEVNVVKEKKLTNVRNTGSEEKVVLTPPRVMTLEDAIGWVAADELIEVTPSAVRLRKRVLESGRRKADRRRAEGA